MIARALATTILFVVAVPALAAVNGWQHDFPLDGYTMTAKGDHPYWSLKPGRFVVLASIESDGSEVVVISVLNETEMVDGVETRVIEEREYEDGELAEISRERYCFRQKS